MLPPMLAASHRISQKHPDASFIIAAPDKEIQHSIEAAILEHSGALPASLEVIAGTTRQVLRQARAAIVTSGTATVEASLMRCPMIIIYRVAPLTYLAGKLLVRVDHIGMVNVIADARVCPELLQANVTPTKLAGELEPLISDDKVRADMLDALDRVNAQLGEGHAAEKAADAVISALQQQ
jgi:lipid-A-disaccharide synthase